MGLHWGDFLGRHFRSIAFTSVLLVFSLLFQSHLPIASHADALPFGNAIETPKLSCSNITKLLQWSKKKYGGTLAVDLSSAASANRAAVLFVEKVDPYKVLFLASEVETLKNRSARSWAKFFSNGQCEGFDTWLSQSYPMVQQRTARLLGKMDLDPIFMKMGTRAENSNEALTKNEDFAANEVELKRRLAQFSSDLISSVPPNLLVAYQGVKFTLCRDLLQQHLFDRKIDSRSLLAKVLLGVMDPFSTYFSSEEFEDFYDELTGATAGLGVKLRKAPQGLMVEKILEDSAAALSKQIHEGDVIETIDGVSLSPLTMEQARPLLKGPENSRVELGIKKVSSSETEVATDLNVVLYRKRFVFDESKISHKWIMPKSSNRKVGVVSIPSFYGRGGMGNLSEERSASEDLKQVVEEMSLEDSNTSSLVLDLRGNPGGYLEEAVSMGGLFLGNKPVVGVVEHGNTRVLSDPEASKPLFDRPLVVLVDQGSASASEVLSGALKDYQRAIIVGTKRTYGKGTVQKLFHLDDPMLQIASETGASSGVLKLTTSVFYSPLGHTPANGGVSTQIAFDDGQGSDKLKSAQIPEIYPILESVLREELEAKTGQHQKLIAELERKSLERRHFANLHDDESELNEAVAIASDLVGYVESVEPGK